MLDVTARTIRNWEDGSSRTPYPAFRLMRLLGGHSLIGKQWEGWSIWRGTLWTPEGRGFEPHELRYLSNYLWMARKWFTEQQAKPKPLCNSTIPAAPASDGSPASRVPRPSSGAGPEHEIESVVLWHRLQEETTLRDHSENSSKLEVLTMLKNQLNNHANR